MGSTTGRGAMRPDPALVQLMMGFYDAVLSMQLRHWLATPDEPRAVRPPPKPPGLGDDFDVSFDDREGGAGARVPRPSRPGPFHPPAVVALDEPWATHEETDLALWPTTVVFPASDTL